LIDHLNLQNVTIIAYSFGGGIALALDTKNIKEMLLLSPAIVPKKKFSKLVIIKKILQEGFSGFFYAYKNKCLPIFFLVAKHFLGNILRKISTYSNITRSGFLSLNRNYDYSSIHIPVAIIGAKHDRFFTWKSMQDLGDTIPNAQIEQVDSIHLWPLIDFRLFEYVVGRYV